MMIYDLTIYYLRFQFFLVCGAKLQKKRQMPAIVSLTFSVFLRTILPF